MSQALLGPSGNWVRRGHSIILVDGHGDLENEIDGPMPRVPPIPLPDRWNLPAAVRAAGEAQHVRYDDSSAWDGGAHCTGRLTEGARVLGAYIRRTFAGVTNVGGYSCRQNTANLAQTSIHGVGRAMDIMIPPVRGRANATVGDPIANWLVGHAAELGIQFVIWNHVSWGGARRAPKDRRYTGPNPHVDHIHAELTIAGSQKRTPWFRGQP